MRDKRRQIRFSSTMKQQRLRACTSDEAPTKSQRLQQQELCTCAFVLAPMREMSMVLVLLLRMQSGRQAFSRSAKMRCFRLTSSSTASTTWSGQPQTPD